MQTITHTTLLSIVGENGGCFSRDEYLILVADSATRDLPVLLRFYTHRIVVPLHTIETQIAAHIDEFRDAQFPATECDRLREQLGLPADIYVPLGTA